MNGVNIFTQNMVRGLSEHGFESTILLTNPNKRETVPLPRSRDLRFVELDTRPADSMLQKWRALRGVLEKNRPCLYFPNYDFHTSCISPSLSESVGIIGVVHSDDPQHYEHFERLGHTWNMVVTVSQEIARQIEHEHPAVFDRLRVIPIGVSVPRQGRVDAAHDEPLHILYTGLLKQHQKRIFDIPKIARELLARGTPFKMTFAGGGPDEEDLRRECEDLVGRDVVQFAGILDRDALARELRRHDVFLMTSDFEGMPNALLEAMAYSLVPVVSEIESGIPEVVRNGSNGLTAPVGDISAFADRLTALHEDRRLLEEMSERARLTILRGPFNLDHMVDSYVEVIDRISEEARARSFPRPRGPVRPPADLRPLWRHYIPQPVRAAWRKLKFSTRRASSSKPA